MGGYQVAYRAAYRAAAFAALAADTRLGAVTQISAWGESLDIDTLPVLGVVTPSETARPSAHGQFERGTLLQVVLKRSGGKTLEDALDADAAAIEAAVVGALLTSEIQCFPEDLTTVVNGEGQRRIGTVVVNFRVTSWRSLGTS